MAEIGSISLYIALTLSSYGLIGSILGKFFLSYQIQRSALRTAYLIPISLLISTLSLVIAFLNHDFRLEYVADHSNLAMNPIYTWVAFYSGNEGSLLYIAMVLSLLTAIAVKFMPKSLESIKPYTFAILSGILTFFLAVMTFMANPFDTLPFIPADGQGINPLLTHPGMFFHPPMLMAGLIGVSVPFSIAMGMLITGHISNNWVEFGRVWSLLIWATLAIGLLLGSWWAYTILGWGGYWAWDPIENVALMPWLVLTAFIHSIMVQKRRGLFKVWNIVLINIAFTLALFGMFINRGGPVVSVHSFASSALGWVFLGFLAFSLVFSFGVFYLRRTNLKGTASLDSMLSREAAFLANNILLLAIAFVTLWGVVFPLVSEVFQGTTVTVAAPFYNKVNGPLFFVLIFLMGVGPLIPWRNSSWGSLRKAIQLPGLVATGAIILLLLMGITKPFAFLSYGLCAFVATGILREWIKGTLSLKGKGHNYAFAFVKLVAANRPRYGGYIAHLALVSLALGVIGSSFYGIQKDVILAKGESVKVDTYNIEYIETKVLIKADRTEFLNYLNVTDDRNRNIEMMAWRAFYPDQNMAATRAAIKSTLIEDLYIVSTEALADGRVAFRILVNPLIWWMWFAGPLLVTGTLIALWPQSTVAFSKSDYPM
ncbi:MAG: cytochrome c-type biogenesis protein CcmF [Chloroflexi bacterium]|nr:MAG: cytochrome c-type biogenesis protein CcmF [Chloroflexota bacterium]